MKLLKILVFIFLVYFIRRFIQMYRSLKQIQQQQQDNAHKSETPKSTHETSTGKRAVDAEFKVLDN